MFAGRLLAHELSQRGIAVGGGGTDAIDTVSLIEPSMELVDSKTIAIITTPIADVLERTNTDSHNLYAEALLKRIGHEITSDPGSWKNGGAVLRMMLAEHLGPEVAENTVISDGSGMSRMNRVSAKTFVQWMRALSRSDHWDAYAASMANPGDGTLRRRFDGGELSSRPRAATSRGPMPFRVCSSIPERISVLDSRSCSMMCGRARLLGMRSR
jgi:D-alanyl-D-alanine carboxypeptidase/D-alanyl-D-alanine-endopeptidase (penicillin-binding protein 4)